MPLPRRSSISLSLIGFRDLICLRRVCLVFRETIIPGFFFFFFHLFKREKLRWFPLSRFNLHYYPYVGVNESVRAKFWCSWIGLFYWALNELEFKFTKKLIVGKSTESHAAFVCAQELGAGKNPRTRPNPRTHPSQACFKCFFCGYGLNYGISVRGGVDCGLEF